ncbi:MAG: hypothetical protein ABF679_06520 [Lentilactobacillus diolivorans]|uniref:hypothetical protein n=1 Tax=Lentilactobacillus diolivorans TaxID=179838 RepID=UPI0039E77AF6
MNKYVLSALVVPVMLFGSVNAQAKTAALKAKVNRVQEGANYVSGKATRGANIKITSHGVTYVAGKANKKGKFEINAHHSFKVGKYRVTISKRGYKMKAFQFKIKADEPTRDVAVTTNTSQVDGLNNEISKLDQQIASLTSQLNEAKKDQSKVDAKQQQALKNQVTSLTSQLGTVRGYAATVYNQRTVSNSELTAANSKIDDLQKKVTELSNDPVIYDIPAKPNTNEPTTVIDIPVQKKADTVTSQVLEIVPNTGKDTVSNPQQSSQVSSKDDSKKVTGETLSGENDPHEAVIETLQD